MTNERRVLPGHVAAVIADLEVKLVAVLLHPDVGLVAVLGVDQLIPVVSVDSAPLNIIYLAMLT